MTFNREILGAGGGGIYPPIPPPPGSTPMCVCLESLSIFFLPADWGGGGAGGARALRAPPPPPRSYATEQWQLSSFQVRNLYSSGNLPSLDLNLLIFRSIGYMKLIDDMQWKVYDSMKTKWGDKERYAKRIYFVQARLQLIWKRQSFYHCNNHVFIVCLYCTMYQDLDVKQLMLIKTVILLKDV